MRVLGERSYIFKMPDKKNIDVKLAKEFAPEESRVIKLSPELSIELDRRIKDLERNPVGTIPWETIKLEALEKGYLRK